MDIDVLGYYDVKQRRTRWQHQHGIVPVDRKAFRICIPREDSDRLLNVEKWPAHISLSSWQFKKKKSENENGNVTDSNNQEHNDGALVATAGAADLLSAVVHAATSASTIDDSAAADAVTMNSTTPNDGVQF